MNRGEILEKSRNENINEDERENYIKLKSYEIGNFAGIIATVAVAISAFLGGWNSIDAFFVYFLIQAGISISLFYNKKEMTSFEKIINLIIIIISILVFILKIMELSV